jgi:hypothetical protein
MPSGPLGPGGIHCLGNMDLVAKTLIRSASAN